jgi:hypothetical protein
MQMEVVDVLKFKVASWSKLCFMSVATLQEDSLLVMFLPLSPPAPTPSFGH